MMSLIFSLLGFAVLMVKDSFLNGIWLNVAEDGDHRIRPAAIDAASRTQNTASHAENRSDR